MDLPATDPGIDAMYDWFGLTSRICFDLNNKVRLAGYRLYYQAALEGLSLECY